MAHSAYLAGTPPDFPAIVSPFDPIASKKDLGNTLSPALSACKPRKDLRMARLSPEQQFQRILDAIRGWEKHAPQSTFSRRTLAQFKEAMQPAVDAHKNVLDLRMQLRIAVMRRNRIVADAMAALQMTGLAVRGDRQHGRDSLLSEAFGHTREVVRRARIRRGMRRRRAKLSRQGR